MTPKAITALDHLRAILDAPGIERLSDGLGAVGLNLPGGTVMLTYGDLRAIREALDYMSERLDPEDA